MNLDDALKKGKVVVVAGAGISKDAPANLPSWWDYNIILIEMIGQIAAKALNRTDNLLNMNDIKTNIPVTSVSEFFVNRIAGSSYYPLLSMLDGAHPNIHHFMLAELAKSGLISAIVTTNFDTLIEKAFDKLKIPYRVYNTPNDYYTLDSSINFPIYKIHGSADKAEFAIDTVHQKLQGLSIEKREIMQCIFSENHIVFMGFSGEDYLFGSDYIPVQANKINNYGITWLSHPGSSFNNNTKRIIEELEIEVINIILPDFYKQHGWIIPKITYNVEDDEMGFRRVAENKIRGLLESSHIGKYACLGMCIQLLDIMNKKDDAEVLVKAAKASLDNMIDLDEGLKRISLYTSMASHAILMSNYNDASVFSNIQLKIFEMLDQFIESNGITSGVKERNLNKSTVLNRVGIIELHLDNYLRARDIFIEAFVLSYNAMHFENVADSLYNISVAEYNIWLVDYNEDNIILPKFVAKMEASRRIAEHGGCSDIIFAVNCKLVEVYSLFGQKSLMEDAFNQAKKINELCIAKEANNIVLDKLKYYMDRCVEQEPWPIEYMFYNEPYDYSNIWQPYGQRPVLKLKEGQEAKKQFDNGQFEKSLNYLVDAAKYYFNNKEYESAEMLSDCAYGIFCDMANKAALVGNISAQRNNLKNAKICLENCIAASMYMSRIDYIAESLGSLSRLNCFDDCCSDLDFAAFQAELSLCICDDSRECWQAVHSAEAAALINLKNGRSIVAEKYCKKYLEMIKINPNAANSFNIELMKNLLKEIESINKKFK